jgi:hypothetical protein
MISRACLIINANIRAGAEFIEHTLAIADEDLAETSDFRTGRKLHKTIQSLTNVNAVGS